jgi:protein involved in polysaccharide export with SLBB domain
MRFATGRPSIVQGLAIVFHAPQLMIRSIRLVTAIIAISAAGELHAQSTPTPAAPAEGLNPGDQVRVLVWRKPELSGDFSVAPNGTITHPLYRSVQVTGVPLSVVEERLRTFLLQYETNPQFVIQPLVKIIVGGEVRAPNLYSVPPETTIAQAVALAGGMTDRGRLDRVRVVRSGQEILVDLTRPDASAAQLQIRSGDQITVARRGSVFRDVVSPAASLVGALAAIAGVVVASTR